MSLIRALVLLLLLVAAWPMSANARSISDAGRELAQALSTKVACTKGEAAKVGVWPFSALDLPISKSAADQAYNAFLSSLLASKSECVDFVEVGDVAAVANLMSSIAQGPAVNATTRDLYEDLQNADYIVAGTILANGSETFAVFRLTDLKTGSLVFETPQATIPASLVQSVCSDARPFQVSLEQLAREVKARASELQHLVVEGGYYANSNGRTGFSQYLEPLLAGEISKAFENQITDRSITVRYVHSENDDALMRLRGLSITVEELNNIEYAPIPDRGTADSGSVFRLRFRYWLCNDTVRLVVNLLSQDNKLVSWTGGIRLDDIPTDVALQPPTPTEVNDWGPDGAFSFRMTSQRGPAPTFRAGDSFEALFLLSRDAWLYCFYTDAAGDTTQMLPNLTQIDRPSSNFYLAGQVNIFPDKERLPEPDPFRLVINAETLGIEVFRCFATSRNVTADLPAALRGHSFDPLPTTYASRLREIFESVQGSSMSTASMTITVLQ